MRRLIGLTMLAAVIASACGHGTDRGAMVSGGSTSETSASPSRRPSTAMPLLELWRHRTDLVGKSVTVAGRVLFVLTCPPPGATPATGRCIAVGYLAQSANEELLPYEDDPAFLLAEDGRAVGCATPTLAAFSCRGWRQGGRYVVTGEIRDGANGGPLADRPVFAAETKQLIQ